MHFLRLTNTFDSRDLIALVQRGKRETGKLAAAVNVDRASTALTMITTLLRSRQMDVLSQTIQKRGARIDSKIILLTVDKERNGNRILQVG